MPIKNKAIILILLLLLITPALIGATEPLLDSQSAADLNAQDQAFLESSGLGTNSPALIVSMIIKAVLSLLGVIFIILIIYAGFLWLTSGGNEETITKAKKTIVAAIIGLAIVLSAYVITVFIIDKIIESTTGSHSRSIGSGGWSTTWGN